MKKRLSGTDEGICAKRAGLTAIFTVLAMAVCIPAAFAASAVTGKVEPAPSAKVSSASPGAPAPALPQQQIRPEAAFALMAGEAEKGNGNAMLTLGRFYEQGVGTARNYTKALEWYGKAATAGQAEGHYNMGVCYEVGMGAASDMGKAVQSYQKAADLGLALAMYKLSSIYVSGNGVPKDTVKGIAWLDKAANSGMAGAANELGLIYLSGLLGQKKDEKKALAMFTKAADLGNLEAIKNIAVIHKDGLGVKADPVKAYTWYLIARRGGYAGEDIARVLGLLEASLTPAQTQQAQKDADTWIESFFKRQSGGQ